MELCNCYLAVFMNLTVLPYLPVYQWTIILHKTYVSNLAVSSGGSRLWAWEGARFYFTCPVGFSYVSHFLFFYPKKGVPSPRSTTFLNNQVKNIYDQHCKIVIVIQVGYLYEIFIIKSSFDERLNWESTIKIRNMQNKQNITCKNIPTRKVHVRK